MRILAIGLFAALLTGQTMAAVKPIAKPAPKSMATAKPGPALALKTGLPEAKQTSPKGVAKAAHPAAPASASARPVPVKHTADGSTEATPAMWVVHGPKGTLYLLGSIHVLPKNVHWQTPEIVAAMKKADTFVFETKMDDESWSDARAQYPKDMLLPIDLALPSFFDQEMRDDYQHVIFRIHANPDGLVYLRPWVAAKALQGQAEGGDSMKGFSTDEGVDVNVYKAAKARGVTQFIPLETVASHLHLLTDDGNIEEGMAELRLTLKRLLKETSDKTIAERMYSAWCRGDVKALAAVGPDNPLMPPDEHKTLLEDRNRAWIPQIAAMLNQKHTYFMTVGAFHLVGKIGVPTLLREKGYRVDGPDLVAASTNPAPLRSF